MRFRRLAEVMVSGLMALALASAPAAAQLSPGYKFLEAVKKKDGEAVEKALGETGPTLINTRDVGTGDSALHVVAQRRDITWLNFLLFKGANANARNDRGVTPLVVAVSLGWIDGAELLLAKGARVNDPDGNGETPLIGAVHQHNIELVRLLLKAGADPARADNSGRSARDYAALLGKDSTVAAEIEAAAKTGAARKKQTYGPSF